MVVWVRKSSDPLTPETSLAAKSAALATLMNAIPDRAQPVSASGAVRARQLAVFVGAGRFRMPCRCRGRRIGVLIGATHRTHVPGVTLIRRTAVRLLRASTELGAVDRALVLSAPS